MRIVVAAVLLALVPAGARAQERDEARAGQLRERARAEVRAGHYEAAYELFGSAASLTRDPAVWLEIAEVADHLRMDAAALAAYERYLDALPNADNAAEIRARVRVLHELASGRRYVLASNQRHVLVDWEGRPMLVETPPPRDLISLAEWDGSLRNARDALRPDLLPFPEQQNLGLGRRLAHP